MTGSVAIDIVLGLVFIYLLYSLLASLIQEIIATNLSFRAKILQKAIGRMLDDSSMSEKSWKDKVRSWLILLLPNWLRLCFTSREYNPSREYNLESFFKKEGLAETFYKHAEIKYKTEDGWHNKPSELSASSFSKVVIDLLRGKKFKIGDNYKDEIQY